MGVALAPLSRISTRNRNENKAPTRHCTTRWAPDTQVIQFADSGSRRNTIGRARLGNRSRHAAAGRVDQSQHVVDHMKEVGKGKDEQQGDTQSRVDKDDIFNQMQP
jgi:hypothetical protein